MLNISYFLFCLLRYSTVRSASAIYVAFEMLALPIRV